TVIHAVLLNPLPYANPERYFRVYRGWRANPERQTVYSTPAALETAQRTRSAEAFGCMSSYFATGFNVSFASQLIHVQGLHMSASLPQTVGVNPAKGRWFRDGTDEPGGLHVVVLSNSLWERLGSDPQIIGKPVRLNSEDYTVVGVTPPGFQFPAWGTEYSLWL